MLTIAEQTFSSRLFTGTGKFGHPDMLKAALIASETRMVTLALKRLNRYQQQDQTLKVLRELDVTLLPNTSGAATAGEAVYAARLARELLGTDWVKLEIHPDQRFLLPDPVETLKAAEQLCREGFHVLPYCHADPVLCKRLEEAGCAAVMPLGAPIGSNKGLQTRDFLQIIIEQAAVPVIVDAGIGRPSHACEAMELGADAVLVNTAIATANDPVAAASAFAKAVEAGRESFMAGAPSPQQSASATSPFTRFLETLS